MKFKKIVIFAVISLLCFPAYAATNDFIANSDITVSDVSFGAGTTNMIIFDGSQAESFSVLGGLFTVTNSGGFQVGSANAAVESMMFKKVGGEIEVCEENVAPGTSYAELVNTATGSYEVIASTTTDCTTLCDQLAGVATYNKFPGCGALTCQAGYVKVGTGATATCIVAASGSGWSQTPPAPTEEEGEEELSNRDNQILQIEEEAEIVFNSGSNIDALLSHNGVARDLAAEAASMSKYVNPLLVGMTGLSQNEIDAINYFIVYGTATTKRLGAGERAGVINSFKAAFGKLPTTEQDWQDVIKIANGRWPTQRSESAENRSKQEFRRVYLREPNMGNPNDNAAVTVIAYGLRPGNRNLDSERAGILIFKDIYGHDPVLAVDWDIVRAISYSGATR